MPNQSFVDQNNLVMFQTPAIMSDSLAAAIPSQPLLPPGHQFVDESDTFSPQAPQAVAVAMGTSLPSMASTLGWGSTEPLTSSGVAPDAKYGLSQLVSLADNGYQQQ